MNFKIDNLQYCNWSREIFQINKQAGLDAIHVTIVYHEDFDELKMVLKKWENYFSENSDLIFHGKSFKDIEKAKSENKTAVFFGFQNCSPIEDDIGLVEKGLCPGLPDWTALKNPACAKNFTTPDSGGKGRMLEGPQSWHGDLIPQRVDALGLGDLWTVKFAGSADALWAELKAAEKEGRGTIIFNWTPNFTDGAGFTFIDFPPYSAGCRPEDGGDGKCGSPDGYLKKAVNADFPKTHPAAAGAFKKMSFSTSHIGAMAALVDLDKMTHEDAAKKWLADNKSVWQAFTK